MVKQVRHVSLNLEPSFLILGQALNLARVEPRHRVINQVTTGIVFLATPHQGSPIADYGAILGMVAKISKLREELVKGLRSSSRTLTVIASEFRQHHDSIQIGSFFEGRGIKIGLFSKIVSTNLRCFITC